MALSHSGGPAQRGIMEKAVGRLIVVDPAICHGEPTFRGTRILVSDVLEQVASGMAWEAIIEQWRGAITKEPPQNNLDTPWHGADTWRTPNPCKLFNLICGGS